MQTKKNDMIDFSLAPSVDTIGEAAGNFPIGMFYLAIDGIKAARRGKSPKQRLTWEDIEWLALHAATAGYFLGVRNERKRRREKAD